MRRRYAAALTAALVLLAGCGTPDDGAPLPSAGAVQSPSASTTPESTTQQSTAEQRHPDIIAVEIADAGDGRFNLDVTVSSPYDTAERYADGWRVLDPAGTVLGEHTLTHDHASEQPFTRTQSGVEIPSDVSSVTVEGRDQEFGYGGDTMTVEVPRS